MNKPKRVILAIDRKSYLAVAGPIAEILKKSNLSDMDGLIILERIQTDIARESDIDLENISFKMEETE